MITKAIEKCLQIARLKNWNKTYWAIDIHGTIMKPNYTPNVITTEFYPFAKEALQMLSKREDIVIILYTCSYPHEIIQYINYFNDHEIHFNYINKNPEVNNGGYGHYEEKFYFNILLEDKAGFDPMNDWKNIMDVMKQL